MALPEDLFAEINELTADLIQIGLCVDQKFPALRQIDAHVRDLDFGVTENLSLTLKNVPYADTYEVLKRSRDFNIKMIDGALVQLMYRFYDNALASHRLAFFPSPDLLEFQSNPEIYELDEMYGDVIPQNVVTLPLRFDFDPEAFVDLVHPKSHLTLGQYKHCRIPVTGPVGPSAFLNFILRSFYNTPFRLYSGALRFHPSRFGRTISDEELKCIHVQVEAAAA